MDENNLSWGRVVDKNSLNNIVLPKEMIENFIGQTSTENALIVFTPRKKILKIDVFPVESKDIVKVKLELTEFSGNTVKQIGQIIRDNNIPKNLFTSGVCIKTELCLYEAYIEERKLSISIKELKEHFSGVDNVVKVEVSRIST